MVKNITILYVVITTPDVVWCVVVYLFSVMCGARY